MEPLLRKLRLVVFDFDGVMTDNRVYVDQNGIESVVCNRSDGQGIGLMTKLGVECIILSTEVNPVVAARAKKLKMECHHGHEDKGAKLREIAREKDVPFETIAYVGNDVNDVTCMQLAGLPVAVADAYPEALQVAKLVLKRKGGDGAVREFCDLVRYARQKE